jgi:hypothetical protein
MRLILSRHAEEAMRRRGLEWDWVHRALLSPDRTEPDKQHPERQHALRIIPERNKKVLRVVWARTGDDFVVITAFFDRKAVL